MQSKANTVLQFLAANESFDYTKNQIYQILRYWFDCCVISRSKGTREHKLTSSFFALFKNQRDRVQKDVLFSFVETSNSCTKDTHLVHDDTYLHICILAYLHSFFTYRGIVGAVTFWAAIDKERLIHGFLVLK